MQTRLRKSTLTDVVSVPLGQWERIHRYRKNKWIYRGMRNSSDALETALERACHTLDGNLKRVKDREQKLLREFRRRYYNYYSDAPHPYDDLEWFALMQHHGCPTRLQDWSYSIYVAAYFALECAEGDCAVWALNTEWAYHMCGSKFPRPEENVFMTKPIIDSRRCRRLFRNIFIENHANKAFISPCAPFRLNQRLTVQKGIFVAPANLSIGFEDNLRAMSGYDKRENIMKLVIPWRQRKQAIEALFYMNVTRASLFPGLDGFAASLGIYHPGLDAGKR